MSLYVTRLGTGAVGNAPLQTFSYATIFLTHSSRERAYIIVRRYEMYTVCDVLTTLNCFLETPEF